jgi:hypothetical protein
MDLLFGEVEFQFAKAKLLEHFREAYEHTCDILEQQKIAQIMTDIMAKRPRINMESTYFTESYECEIKVFKEYGNIIREFMDYQIENERQENNHVKDYLELKYRKINDHMQKQW